MRKVITITLSDEKCAEFYREVGEIVGIATYLEAQVEIRDDLDGKRKHRLVENP